MTPSATFTLHAGASFEQYLLPITIPGVIKHNPSGMNMVPKINILNKLML